MSNADSRCTPCPVNKLPMMHADKQLCLCGCAVAPDEQQSPHFAVSTFFARRFARSSSLTGPLESTALASLSHSACIIIDMGNFVLSECRNRAYTAEDAALPCIAGEHVRQILPEALVERAALLPALDPARQVTPVCSSIPPGLPESGRQQLLHCVCLGCYLVGLRSTCCIHIWQAIASVLFLP